MVLQLDAGSRTLASNVLLAFLWRHLNMRLSYMYVLPMFSPLCVYGKTVNRQIFVRKLTDDGVFGDPIELPLYEDEDAEDEDACLFMYDGRIYLLTINDELECMSIIAIDSTRPCRILAYVNGSERSCKTPYEYDSIIRVCMLMRPPTVTGGKLYVLAFDNIQCIDLATMDVVTIPYVDDCDKYVADHNDLFILQPYSMRRRSNIVGPPINVTYWRLPYNVKAHIMCILNREIILYTTSGCYRVTNIHSDPVELEPTNANTFIVASMRPVVDGIRTIVVHCHDEHISRVSIMREDDRTLYDFDFDGVEYDVIS